VVIDHVVKISRNWQLSKVSRIPFKYLHLVRTIQMYLFQQQVYRVFVKASATLLKR